MHVFIPLLVNWQRITKGRPQTNECHGVGGACEDTTMSLDPFYAILPPTDMRTLGGDELVGLDFRFHVCLLAVKWTAVRANLRAVGDHRAREWLGKYLVGDKPAVAMLLDF